MNEKKILAKKFGVILTKLMNKTKKKIQNKIAQTYVN